MKFPYLIAEIGSCFITLDDCYRSIAKAKAAGCDAVKFQMANYETLYGIDYPHDKRLRTPFVSEHWIPKLRNEADNVGIDFMCTGFSPDDILYLENYVTHHKISSIEAEDWLLLKEVLKSKKHLFISLGTVQQEWLDGFILLIKCFKKNLTLLACTVNYPSTYAAVDNALYLRSKYRSSDISVGISDHALGIHHLIERRYCFDVIEKHFNPLGIKDRPDSPHSISMAEMKVLSEYLNKNLFRYDIEESEEAVRVNYRSIVAARDIKMGVPLVLKDLNSIRKPGGLAPIKKNIDALIGKRTDREYKIGEFIRF